MNKVYKLPVVGRVGVSTDRFGSATRAQSNTGENYFETNLTAEVFDKNGNPKLAKEVMPSLNWLDKLRFGNRSKIDLGSGLVTNVGVLGLAAGFNFGNPSGVQGTVLSTAKWHCSGTGVTAAATTDIKLQTASGFGGATPVAGTQVLISAANLQKYQSVATIAYTGTEAVTEWGLLCAGTLTATTGSPFTATSATSGTVTATPLTASSATVLGQQLNIVEAGTTASWGLVTSNTTSVFNFPAWYATATGAAGTTPGATETYTIRPIMWDHKIFSAINVVSGDSIVYTYTLTINSGG